MKRISLAILLILSIYSIGLSQATSHTAFRIRIGTTVPAACTLGDVFFQQSDSTFYGCTASNAWTALSSGGGFAGSVTSVSVVTNDGVSGTVATASTTPAITLSLGIISPDGVDTKGTAGAAHVYFPSQSALFTVTSSGFSITADATKRPVFSTNAGQTATFDFLSLASSGKVFTFPNSTGTLAVSSFANVFTTSQAIQPATDVISLVARRNAAGQTSNIVEIQTELNALLASIDKSGNVLGANFTSTGQSYFINSAGTVFWKAGAGDPEGAVTAAVGSLWTRTDGGVGSTLYVKESGTGNTGWAVK